MLIVQITQDFFSHGAVMRRARQETKALLDAGHRVVVITDLKAKSHYKEMIQYKKKLEVIPLTTIFIYFIRRISSKLTFSLKVLFSLRKMEESGNNIDLVVSHDATLSYGIVPFIKKCKIPAIWVIQDLIRDRMATGNPYNWLETQMYKHSNKYAIKNIPYLIPVSSYTRDLALLDGGNPETTIIKYNAVNTEKFKPKRNIRKDIDILFFGRLSIEKGVDILINSTKYIQRNRRVIIIGKGPLEKELKELADRLDKNIEFWGFVSHSRLPKIISRAKLVVTPSRSECHAAVPLEAMACGVPVIASRVAGMDDTIQNNVNGWLLDKNNPKVLGKTIEKVLNDSEMLREISLEAENRAKFFSVKKLKKEIVSFYEKIVNEYNKSNN